ncbi:hypothetical protein LTR85_004349 [Meristemomyces frigidus]|nr:hypothetical protein LTR85_004349 [Meristemomyces frigidus]
MDVPFGNDNACDTRLPSLHSPTIAAAGIEALQTFEDVDAASDDEDDYFQVPIPTVSTGTTTFAYQLALQNRIKNGKLVRHGEYDMGAYKPTFIHDSLMLPGSLANFLGKRHPKNLVPKMTPALLPGFHAYVHSETQQPCILQSPNATDYVQGMLIFGQGKKARRLIHEHYRAKTRRVTVEVQVDVAVPVPLFQRKLPTDSWRLKRRIISAHAWIWSNAGSGDVQFRTQCPKWTLEDYIEGNLAPKQPLRIERAGFLEDEVSIIENDNEDEEEVREVIYGGCGALDYDRGPGFTGW